MAGMAAQGLSLTQCDPQLIGRCEQSARCRMKRGCGAMLTAVAAETPAGDDQRLSGGNKLVDMDADAAEQRQPGLLLDREIAGAVERRPDELRPDVAVGIGDVGGGSP